MDKDAQTYTGYASDLIQKAFAESEGRADADRTLTNAERRASARAARILAATQCPDDLKEWGRAHGIPTFAEYTWQAGFLAGLRCAELRNMEEESERATD